MCVQQDLFSKIPLLPINLSWTVFFYFRKRAKEGLFYETHKCPYCLISNCPFKDFLIIGTSVWRSSRSAFGRPTGNDVSGHKFSFLLFPFLFFPVVYFSHRRSARIKKLIQRKLTGAPQNLGVDPFPVPVGHFGAPWRPFWIFEVLIEGMVKQRNLFCES